MSRSHVNHFSIHPYHITGRTVNRIPYHLPLQKIWEIMSDQLFLAHYLDGLRIHAFVLMPNHFHLLASVTESDLPTTMARIMRDSSKTINSYTGRINQNWGGRHYKCEITSYHYFLNTYKYIYQNPVRAGLSKRAQDWPYSTLSGLMGLSRVEFPLTCDELIFPAFTFDSAQLEWINRPIAEENLTFIRSALTKKQFKLPKTTNCRLSPIENNLI